MLLYRLLISILAAVVLTRAALRADGRALRDRLGRNAPQSEGAHIWLHAASNGELASARPVIAALRAAYAQTPLLITCNSESGVALARSWGIDRVSAHLAPLDLSRVSRRMMKRWKVRAFIAMESELWPHRILSCQGPVIVLGARMSAGTAKSWVRLDRLARRVLGRVVYASAQDAGSRQRLVSLGLPEDRFGPDLNLKALYLPSPMHDPALAAAFDRAETWLAASTHEGEEDILAKAHQLALQKRPNLRLILAPRHPGRGDEVAAILTRAGLSFSRRSKGQSPEGVSVYLADTLGEMPLWYDLAGVCFIAGSLTDRGGHTPFEPAAHGQAILHGPDVANFADSYAALQAAGVTRLTPSADTIARALNDLADPAVQASLGAQARAVLAADVPAEQVLQEIIAALR
ncbi:glycosyltransferase N-terminal domain-containing protein [Mesobacterium sp. TK19101]|uniref:3-deoxy-D-manno-octulosonic acid transferase n=1 Tax=Mesobacterium hydrothermale TaxID=3111907 RepID=A0ABU6HJM5_9RHOB|nr:glycosyltransferase N-terminal domain-containing protein [Mesobacterium sp. TK19101]MEC3862045.1 glycosyltransferase N-terminal domain-containing protein [Mesobacterium sp. TK19101]